MLAAAKVILDILAMIFAGGFVLYQAVRKQGRLDRSELYQRQSLQTKLEADVKDLRSRVDAELRELQAGQRRLHADQKRLRDEIEGLHEKASEFGTGMQTKVGDLLVAMAVTAERMRATEMRITELSNNLQNISRFLGKMTNGT